MPSTVLLASLLVSVSSTLAASIPLGSLSFGNVPYEGHMFGRNRRVADLRSAEHCVRTVPRSSAKPAKSHCYRWTLEVPFCCLLWLYHRPRPDLFKRICIAILPINIYIKRLGNATATNCLYLPPRLKLLQTIYHRQSQRVGIFL